MFSKILRAVGNIFSINKTTHEVYTTKQKMMEFFDRFDRYRALEKEKNELVQKEFLSLKQSYNEAQKKLQHYNEIHHNTERKMYHYLHQQFLGQSLILQDLVQKAITQPESKNIEAISKSYLDSYYLDFENRFRGTREGIYGRYLEYFCYVDNQPTKALDIGCGRGEWVQILQENGIDAEGVDINEKMLGVAKDHGVKNLYARDAMEFLKESAAQSYDLISAFHIVEHIPYQELLLLLAEIKRVAKPGALILLETPNASNLQVAATHFYTDPTHLNPIPHRVLEFMLEYIGFASIKTHFINPYDERFHIDEKSKSAEVLNDYLFQAQDYLVVARV